MIRSIFLLGLMFTFYVGAAMAQTGTIKGTVIDKATSEPLPGVNVGIKSIGKGSATDAEGHYIINNVPSGTYKLSVSFVGYQSESRTVEVTSGSTKTIDFRLIPTTLGLNEMVVTGYGEVAKDKYTGSISTVSSDNIENRSVTSIDQAIKGNITGASISASSGTPGSPQQILIRGISSINAGTGPLYVIDGVPVANYSTGGNGSSPLSQLSSLSPSDIKSVSILKGAAATAPYGARGSNGVIVIETKDGRSGEVTYSVSSQVGFTDPAVRGPGTITGSEWDQYYRTAVANADPNLSPSQVNDPYWDGTTSTDWRDAYLRDRSDALQQQYSLSAQGGNNQTTFYAAGSYFNKKGVAIGVDFDRITGKLDISHKLDERITLNNKLTGSYDEQNGMTEGSAYFANPMAGIFFNMPIDAPYNKDGSYNLNMTNNTYNAAYIQDHYIKRKRNYRLLNNTELKAQILDNFSFSTRFNVDFNLQEGKNYRGTVYGGGASLGGDVSDWTDRYFNYVWKNTFRYNWTVNQNNTLDIRAIAESQKQHTRYLSGYGTGVAAEGLFNLDTVANPQGVGSSTYDWAVQSFVGLVNYSYKDKFLIDASFRREGNSRFSGEKRWGNFWSLGTGYILTEEAFLHNVSWLNFLKLRASYGKTGNASIGLNQYQATVGFGSYNGQPDILLSGLGNRELTWENKKSIEGGIEFRIFDSKLRGSATFFRENSYNMLFSVPLSRTTGHNSQTQNLGKLYNQGIELELNANVIQKKHFSWDFGANFTKIKNEVTQLPKDSEGNPREIKTSTRYRAVKGYEVDAWYMKEWAGVDPQTGDPLWYMDDGNGGRTTTNNYNQADSYYQGGNALPTTYGGINTQVNVFGFYASANLYYAFGNKVYDNWGLYLENGGDLLFYGRYSTQMDYWKKPGDHARNPKPIQGGNRNSNAVSSRYLYDGDYLRLKTIRVGYNIPSKYLDNFGFKSATVYFVGENLWTHAFDDDLKYDPNVNAGGFLNYQGAPLKSITLGIKADF